MSEVVVDAATAEKLLAADEAVLKDASGRVLGRFRSEELRLLYESPEAQDHGMSPEELARALAPDAKTYTTEEVLAHLRSLK